MTESKSDDKGVSQAEASEGESDQEQTSREGRSGSSEHTKRAAQKAADELKAEQQRKQAKGKRKWYHWVIDAALLAVTIYLIKTRFFSDKQKMVPTEPTAQPQTSGESAPAPAVSAMNPRVVVNPTRVLQGPGYQFAVAEVLSAPVRAEMLEAPQAGWVKVKYGPKKEGWVTVDAVSDPMRRDR